MDNFRIIPCGMLEVNCYLVYDEAARRLFVIDPGDDGDLILAAAQNYPASETVILLTHAHVDHIGAVPEVARKLNVSKVYLAQADEELYHSPENHILPYIPAVGNLPDTSSDWPYENPQLLLTPGHSRGGSCFYFPELKLVISGDTLFAGSVGRTDLPGGSFSTLEKSIREKLFALPDETKVYPGHGPATTIQQEKAANPYLQ